MLFRPPLQLAQIGSAPRLGDTNPRSRNNPVKNASHKESFDYKGTRRYSCRVPHFSRALCARKPALIEAEGWGF
jgi:hypothetical protein